MDRSRGDQVRQVWRHKKNSVKRLLGPRLSICKMQIPVWERLLYAVKCYALPNG